MPFYTWLRPGKSQNRDLLQEKKRATTKLLALRKAIRAHIDQQQPADGIPPPTDSTKIVRLATWNIREFDSNSYGLRLRESKAYIAEILSHFDLIAVQEVREDCSALDEVMRLLGPNWSYIATDVTEGSPGNRERMAFVFNREKTWFRGIAGELTLPFEDQVTDPSGERFQIADGPLLQVPAGQALVSPVGLKIEEKDGVKKLDEVVEMVVPAGSQLVLPTGTAIVIPEGTPLAFTADDGIDFPQGGPVQLPEGALVKLPADSIVGGPLQFARTPFVVSFQAGWLKINLCTVHIYYGEGTMGLERRKEEIRRLTKLLAKRAGNDNDSDSDAYFIALGDFNIVGKDHDTMEALKTNEFKVPDALFMLPGSNVKKDKYYDQIAVWSGESPRRKTYTRAIIYRAGIFDYFETVFRTDEEAIYRRYMKKPHRPGEFYRSYNTWRTHQMSDHLPMWVELHIDFSDYYLEEVRSEIESRLER